MLCFRFEMSITGRSAETGPAITSEVASAVPRKNARSRFMPGPRSSRVDVRPAILLGLDQVGCPVELPLTEPGRREALTIGSRPNRFQPLQVLGLADAGER